MAQFSPLQDLKKNIATNRATTGGKAMPMTPEVLQRKELHAAIQQKRAAEIAEFIGGTIPSPVQPMQRKAIEEQEVAQTKKEEEPIQKQEGTVSHQGEAGKGKSKGKVIVKENDEHKGSQENDFISLEYQGDNADRAHWLQFVNFSMIAEETPGTPIYNDMVVKRPQGRQAFSTDKATHWYLDLGRQGSPYYDVAAASERVPQKSVKIFDVPGKNWGDDASNFVLLKAPKAKIVRFVAEFDSYLVLDSAQPIYHVTWRAVVTYDVAAGTTSPIDYETTSGGVVNRLPKNFKKMLVDQFPDFKSIR